MKTVFNILPYCIACFYIGSIISGRAERIFGLKSDDFAECRFANDYEVQPGPWKNWGKCTLFSGDRHFTVISPINF
jgi:hypothetical protein